MCHEMKLSGGFVNHQILLIMPTPRFRTENVSQADL
jgi:hypothetical protein